MGRLCAIENKVMFKLKIGTVVLALTLALAFFVWTRGTAEEVPVPTGEFHCVGIPQERLKATIAELEQTRRDFQIAKERISALERNLATTEYQPTDSQRLGINFQEGHDITREDLDLIRTEREHCAGDRAHLDDVVIRYQASQTRLHELQQRLHDAEISIAAITRERDNLRDRYNWIKASLNAVLQENDEPRYSENAQSDRSIQNIRNAQSSQK